MLLKTSTHTRPTKHLCYLVKHFLFVDEKQNADEIKSEIVEMINALPKDNMTIKENRRKIEHVFEDNFWDNIAEDPIEHLENQVAPLLKHQSDIDVDKMSFQLKTQQIGLAILTGNEKTKKTLQKSIANNVNDLRQTINAVKEKRDDIKKVLTEKFWNEMKYEDADYLENTFASIMQYREKNPRQVIELDLEDIIAEQRLIKKVKTISSEFVKEYRQKIEHAINRISLKEMKEV